jgi:hypothetical protein
MQEVLINLLANFIWALIGVAGVLVWRSVFNIMPARRLWRFKNPEKLIICATASTKEYTGKYYRPSTGIGQLRALAILMSSLNTAYKGIKIKNIVMSDEALSDRVENDIIILGGPKTNHLTRKLLDCIQEQPLVDENEQYIEWKIAGEEGKFPENPESEGQIHRDYGLIIRMKNPFSSDGSTVCLFSGHHTYGVIAAASYFINHYGSIVQSLKTASNLIAVIECDVIDNYPVRIRLKREKTF